MWRRDKGSFDCSYPTQKPGGYQAMYNLWTVLLGCKRGQSEVPGLLQWSQGPLTGMEARDIRFSDS